jgi:putative acetyltransferase
VYALDLLGLATQDVSFYAAWDNDMLMGMGALKEIDVSSGKIKSMRTSEGHLRKGVAAALLAYIINEASRAEAMIA